MDDDRLSHYEIIDWLGVGFAEKIIFAALIGNIGKIRCNCFKTKGINRENDGEISAKWQIFGGRGKFISRIFLFFFEAWKAAYSFHGLPLIDCL